MKNNVRVFAAAKKASTLELLCYDVIGDYWGNDGITAKNVSARIAEAGDFSDVLLRINSPGGNAFEGIAIKNILQGLGKPVHVKVDGVAASAASVIAMAGTDIEMGDGAMMMIHNAWFSSVGDAKTLRKDADTLDAVSVSIAQAYVSRTGLALNDVQALMDAETWLTAEQAVEKGFAHSVMTLEPEAKAQAVQIRNSFNLDVYANVPETLKPAASVAAAPAREETVDEPQPVAAPAAPAPPAGFTVHDARIRLLKIRP